METFEKDAFVDIWRGVEYYKQGEDSKEKISHKLLTFIYKLDTEFPLSGGETQKDMSGAIDYIEHEAHALLNGVDINFPLSGGE